MLFENPSGARTVRGIMTQVQASCEFHISYGHSTEQGRTRQTSSVSRDGRTLAKLVVRSPSLSSTLTQSAAKDLSRVNCFKCDEYDHYAGPCTKGTKVNIPW
ncbi:hypothetical protein PC116_g20211 [Phytophthora cactorum]|uniref:Uncharacterized protein n=1 Tax=Phytophthora cactorum TaxID=29920 RepID=A0A8T1CB63_9STRA|nr:hypothetical protein PC114_g17679 [Phytophthora cactorum]KAG2918299.1 hypothetical protein PC117_g17119 [Phytophthora cactorum]KAG3009942.1 hypothetical protein PC120_g15340 [Phytophthora cactorum]KAG3146276.1 hypothetical protein C6341_g18081 [Phytophthora cactorum]KAG4231534.1 hypothetical protein PC116_g20211 [Phytophthora cactorum]